MSRPWQSTFPGTVRAPPTAIRRSPTFRESWQEIEIEPYRTLAKDGLLDVVMVGHLYHPRFSDGAKLPASLSGRAVQCAAGRGLYRL